MSWPISINTMAGDSFCGKWPRDSWGTRSQLHGQLKSCAAPRAAEKLRTGSVSGVDSRWGERVCCLLVLNLVSSTLSCIRQPRPRL